MANLVVLSGNLGKDPKVKYTEKGAVTYISLAVNDESGKERKPMWFTIQAIGKLAEAIGNNLQKGRSVLVEARYKTGVTREGEVYIYLRAKKVEFGKKAG